LQGVLWDSNVPPGIAELDEVRHLRIDSQGRQSDRHDPPKEPAVISSESLKQNRARSVLRNDLNASIISFGSRATALSVAYNICRPDEIIRAMPIEI
jgi:hypothetical protein